MCQRYALENRVAACAIDAPMPCIIRGLRHMASYFLTFGVESSKSLTLQGFPLIEDMAWDSRKDHYQKPEVVARHGKVGGWRGVNARQGHFPARGGTRHDSRCIYICAALRRFWRDCVAPSSISRFPPSRIALIYLIYLIYVITWFEGWPPSPAQHPPPMDTI